MICLHPHCGRDVGSKGIPHEPDSCGKPSCDMFSRGARFQRRLSAIELMDALRLPAAEQGMLLDAVRAQVREGDASIDVERLIRWAKGDDDAEED